MSLLKLFKTRAGFTLIEIMIVVSVIGLLTAGMSWGIRDSSIQTRDAKRQADLRSLQNAIEAYKQENGRYPEGCNAVGGWSGQLGTDYQCPGASPTGQYITGLAPKYIAVLPADKKLNGTNSGYVYQTNTNGTVYKIMALRTVESEQVSYNHPMKSCDIRPDAIGRLQNLGATLVDTAGWCKIIATGPTTFTNIPVNCRMSSGVNASDGGNGRFEISYGLWGGFEALTTGASKAAQVRNTTAVICQ